MRLIVASNNVHKLAEMQALFSALPVQLIGQATLGIREAAEPFATFVENALAKARHASEQGGSAAIADGSGLCVAALGGAPGVRSARFAALAGRPSGDAENNALLLERMAGVADRRARFVSVLVALRSADDPEPLIAVGDWSGELLDAPRGASGFGYDPLLYVPALGCSVGELDAATKNAHSHRSLAAGRMRAAMQAHWFG